MHFVHIKVLPGYHVFSLNTSEKIPIYQQIYIHAPIPYQILQYF